MLFETISLFSSFPPAATRNGALFGTDGNSNSLGHKDSKEANMRAMFTRTLVALALTTIGALAADNTIGTWKLNVAKSKYTPGPMPLKSASNSREAAEGGIKVTITGERPDGTAINATYTAKYDGNEVPITGNLSYDTIAIKQLNA